MAELAEYIAAADPKPRLGAGYRLPLIYAGNVDAPRDRPADVGKQDGSLNCREPQANT